MHESTDAIVCSGAMVAAPRCALVRGISVSYTHLEVYKRQQWLIPCVDELWEKSLPVEVEDEILKTILSFPEMCIRDRGRSS